MSDFLTSLPEVPVPSGWRLTAKREGHSTWFTLTNVADEELSAGLEIATAHLLALPLVFRARVLQWMTGIVAEFPAPPPVVTRRIDLSD